MQMMDASEARKQWAAKGNPPCEHEYEKEYALSMDTGDYVCRNCGDELTREERMKRRQQP